MSRHARGGRVTCESRLSIDVRQWHRLGLLRPGRPFTWSWTRHGEPLGSIDVRTEADAVIVTFQGSGEWRLPLTWTKCRLGGVRPWFRCRYCWQRMAILYMCDASTFACRRCLGLAYMSQEIPRHRAILRAQRLKMRLGGSANLSEPLPGRPRGMHRLTYWRLLGKAIAAQERALGLEVEYMRRRYPGVPRNVTWHANVTVRKRKRSAVDNS
jgi:hypothetical protein